MICIPPLPVPPRHWAWGIWGSLFLRAQSLRSIWLTWKQMCFHRSDSGFIAARSKAWVQCVCLAKNKKEKNNKKGTLTSSLWLTILVLFVQSDNVYSVRWNVSAEQSGYYMWHAEKGSWLKSYKILIGGTSATSCDRVSDAQSITASSNSTSLDLLFFFSDAAFQGCRFQDCNFSFFWRSRSVCFVCLCLLRKAIIGFSSSKTHTKGEESNLFGPL